MIDGLKFFGSHVFRRNMNTEILLQISHELHRTEGVDELILDKERITVQFDLGTLVRPL